MRPGARTPEELETLLEDAFVIRDGEALAELFEDGAVLVAGEGARQARGGDEIARLAREMWERNRPYLADPRLVLQARNTGLVVTKRASMSCAAEAMAPGAMRSLSWLATKRPKRRTNDARDESDVGAGAAGGAPRRGRGALVVRHPRRDQDHRGCDRWAANDHRHHQPPGWEAPLHVHHRDDEGFWVLEGSATFEVGDRTIEASAGDYLFGPRDIPHRYTVGDSGCRMLFIMVPGGMEDVVRATSEPAASRTLPPPPDEEPDIDAIKEIVKQHGYELLV